MLTTAVLVIWILQVQGLEVDLDRTKERLVEKTHKLQEVTISLGKYKSVSENATSELESMTSSHRVRIHFLTLL